MSDNISRDLTITEIEHMNQNSMDYWGNLRAELKRWKEHMKVSDEEIAVGLGISRQTVQQFMTYKIGEDGKIKQVATLPIHRNNLISLFDYVTSQSQIEADKPKKSASQKDNRLKLRQKTANDLLEQSGFLGITRQSIIKNNFSEVEKFQRIVFRLSNKSLTTRDIWRIEEMIINHLAQLDSNPKGDDSLYKVDDIKKWLETIHEDIDICWPAIKNTLTRYKKLGRKSFKKVEILELFESISENKILRSNSNQRIRVTHYETRTINSVYKRLSKIESSTYFNVLEDVSMEGRSTENKLRMLDNIRSPFNGKKLSFNSMYEVRLSCKIGEDENQEFTWIYRSCSSPLDNMISAIQEGMGHDLELKDLSGHILSEGADSIVRVSAILGNNNSFYTGRWVDIDMILSFGQAIIIASENWIKEKINEKNNYYKDCRIFANNIEKIDILIGRAYEYGFKPQINNDIDENSSISINDNPTISAFDTWITNIETIIQDYLGNPSGVYSHYIKTFKKYKRQAQLAQSRVHHISGNINAAKDIVKIVEKEINLEEEGFFDPSIILFEVENMMQKFYSGEGEFFDERLWHKDLERIEARIEKYLQNGRGVILTTDSLYRSLAELYGNISKFDFYYCGVQEFNFKRLQLALTYSKRAVYFSMKTDDEKRASHWLARCGRILCRLNKGEEAKSYIDAAGEILYRSTISTYQYIQRSEALKLEVYIANGELALLNENLDESVEFFFKALKGSVYLRFARILAGSLYGIYRTSQNEKINNNLVCVQIKQFNEDLKRKKDDLKRFEKLKIEEIVDPTNIFEEIEKFLRVCEENHSENCSLPYGEFKKKAIAIWNNWNMFSLDENTTKIDHPVAQYMRNGIFLGIVDNDD